MEDPGATAARKRPCPMHDVDDSPRIAPQVVLPDDEHREPRRDERFVAPLVPGPVGRLGVVLQAVDLDEERQVVVGEVDRPMGSWPPTTT